MMDRKNFVRKQFFSCDKETEMSFKIEVTILFIYDQV